MYLLFLIVVFLGIVWGLYREGVIDNDTTPIVLVFGGFALAGYLGVSQY